MSTPLKKLVEVPGEMVNTVESTVRSVGESVEYMLQPVRKSVFERYPTLFLLAVTIGGTLTFQGIERFVALTPSLYNHPLLMTGIGVGILVLTGRLYKKLG